MRLENCEMVGRASTLTLVYILDGEQSGERRRNNRMHFRSFFLSSHFLFFLEIVFILSPPFVLSLVDRKAGRKRLALKRQLRPVRNGRHNLIEHFTFFKASKSGADLRILHT